MIVLLIFKWCRRSTFTIRFLVDRAWNENPFITYERHQDNAKAIAEFLREQPQIDSVLYPNKGGMLSFRLKDENWVNTFLKSIKLITLQKV